jgi:DtxR family Mn-dependent transcriptional regulator
VSHGHDLIDTSQMYLRTVLELEEEGIVPLRARIAERLDQSVPTVSQTVSRMERDGLLTVTADRRIDLTDEGRAEATRVMRKHRLAECLLVQVIGLDWQLVHDEACRWEHVMSETVERRLLEILGHPTESPYGNPIPGLEELGESAESNDFLGGIVSLTEVPKDTTNVVVRRIGEPIQSDSKLMTRLRRAGLRPNGPLVISRIEAGKMQLGEGNRAVSLDNTLAAHVFVSSPA